MMLLCQLSDIFFRPSCSFLDEIHSHMHMQEVHHNLVAILHSSFCESALFSLCESALFSFYKSTLFSFYESTLFSAFLSSGI